MHANLKVTVKKGKNKNIFFPAQDRLGFKHKGITFAGMIIKANSYQTVCSFSDI